VIRIRCAAEEEEGARRDSKQKEDDDEAAFEERLAKLQRKATSGTGKKAELRKARKAEGTSSSSSSGNPSSRGKSKSIMLPPVALQEPVSDGLEVALGFNSYTERLNGRFAGLGLAAMLLVELATGGSFLKYHDISTLSTQLYAMLAAAALFVKYEKEKVSVWPKN
jgi:FK506-binding nuclear protein